MFLSFRKVVRVMRCWAKIELVFIWPVLRESPQAAKAVPIRPGERTTEFGHINQMRIPEACSYKVGSAGLAFQSH